MDWLKEAFAVKTEDFSANDIFFSADLFSSVGIEAPGAGEDLALLSLCNHSIISVSCGKYFCIKDFFCKFSPICQASTFGQWGALLAGGQVLLLWARYIEPSNTLFCQFINLQAQSLLTATEFSNYRISKRVFDTFPISGHLPFCILPATSVVSCEFSLLGKHLTF